MELPRELVELIQEKRWLLTPQFIEYEQPFLLDNTYETLVKRASPSLVEKFLELYHEKIEVSFTC